MISTNPISEGVRVAGPLRGRGQFFYPDFERHNACRALDWRWARARDLVERRRPLSARRDDFWTLRAANYLRSRGRAGTPRQLANVERKYSDIVAAQGLHEDHGTSKWIVEARCLARQPLPEIAEHVGLPLAGIEAYEAICFNVLDRLDASTFILLQTMKPIVRCEATASDRGTVLRWLGYFGGPIVLDAVTSFVLNPAMDFDALPDAQRRLGERVRMLTRLLTTPVNDTTLGKLLRLQAKVVIYGQEVGANPADAAPHAGFADAILSGLFESLDDAPATGSHADMLDSGAVQVA